MRGEDGRERKGVRGREGRREREGGKEGGKEEETEREKGGRGRERWRRQGTERAGDRKNLAIIVEKSVPFPRTDSHVAVELNSSRSLHPQLQSYAPSQCFGHYVIGKLGRSLEQGY